MGRPKGGSSWNKGIPRTEEVKRVIGEKNRHRNLGRVHSLETRRKMSEAAKLHRWAGQAAVRQAILVSGQKKCSKCGELKPLEAFGKTVGSNLGYISKCKDCSKQEALLPESKAKNLKLRQVRRLRPEQKFKDYQKRAEANSTSFDLTFEQFMTFWQKPCSYSKHPIATIGLDRVDSDLGYTLRNVVPCCEVCNRGKLLMPAAEFIEWIHLLLELHKKENF